MGRQKLGSRFGTYMQKNGQVFCKIWNMMKLKSKLTHELGPDWKQKSIKTYGPEQLGL